MADQASDSADQTQNQDQAASAATDQQQADQAARTFSQEDVDRIVKERVARAKATPPADYEDLKASAAKLAEIEEANKTELEKERDKAAKAEERALKVEAEAKEIKLRSAILAEAAKPDRKVVDTDAVISLLDRSTLELDDAGSPTNIAKAMDSLLEARPYLVAQAGGARGNADQGARGRADNQLSQDDLKSMGSAEIVKAQAEGRLDDLLGVKS
jgi:hypothetical protein